MISPDGKRVLGDHLGGGVLVLELATGVTTRLGFDAGSMSPVWSPDGKYVASRFNPGASIGKLPTERGKPAPAKERSSVRSQELVAGWTLPYLCAGHPATGSADLFALPLAGIGARWYGPFRRTRIRGSFPPTVTGWHTPRTSRA